MDQTTPQQTGFVFDNVARNAMLERTGLKVPRGVKTGTTICGIVFKDGVILGADTRATEVRRAKLCSVFVYGCRYGDQSQPRVVGLVCLQQTRQ